MRWVTEQRTLPALGSGGITGLNVGRRSPCSVCSLEPPFLLPHYTGYWSFRMVCEVDMMMEGVLWVLYMAIQTFFA